LILDAARVMHVPPELCVVVGDRESDVEAAVRAGAVPLKIDGPRELPAAVDMLLAQRAVSEPKR
jgi:beta-phosphoglucomutase-like phosphatase (HAD superfamily)